MILLPPKTMTNSKLHTTEHILWQVLKGKLSSLKTRALQFTNDYCRLDFITNNEELNKKDLKKITKTVNEVIDKNLKVAVEIMSREEAKDKVDLSLIPRTVRKVRIVRIGNFSIEACANQHVKYTSEIGKFRIIEYKKIGKNTFRIKFTVNNLKAIG